ncbi:hypothetical protein P153DRAFT_435093 [Dothidotthia symphoricarpi CBS 119687]|uniref:Ecp2 effector protein domain-containing protein n=1 Tax=Dothidotthia symphoricarpi CBS 119687 TaxID=1392245 RepID=A0A6A6A1R3_9PLEO|nr:uncharacterized protein P153DRAFT_435093 [Dothidotthia symphoricarpi CBS 119687]KAF2124887.1 hypothetical protein P153DRAFT_435093 [Dothidotthia symphoricarpi CBS 119687]
MRFFSIAAALSLCALTQALVIPTGTTQGLYEVSTLDDGTEVHTKLADYSETEVTPVSEASPLERRQNGRMWCGCGFTLNHGDCDAAVADLKSQFRPSLINGGKSFYSIRGSVVAFACNRSQTDWLLLPQTFTDAASAITGSCGWYIAGTTERGDANNALILGYMRYQNGLDFCGASTSSPANRC